MVSRPENGISSCCLLCLMPEAMALFLMKGNIYSRPQRQPKILFSIVIVIVMIIDPVFFAFQSSVSRPSNPLCRFFASPISLHDRGGVNADQGSRLRRQPGH